MECNHCNTMNHEMVSKTIDTTDRIGDYTLTTHGLSKSYKNILVVNNLNITVPSHGIYGFLGPNGAGKSTTLKMVLGLTRSSSGSIQLFNMPFNLPHRVELLNRVGALIETPSYYPNLTARENLEIVRSLKGLKHSEIDEVLRAVKLDTLQTQKKLVRQFSLGMKQRLGIAKALMGKPPFIILDEPTNGLDPEGIHEIRALIKSLPEKYCTTVLVSSHILSEIDQIADYIGIIDQGNMKFQGSLQSLHSQGKSWLEIRTNNNPAAYQILLDAQLIKPHTNINPQWIIVPSTHDHMAAQICRTLSNHQIDLLRMEERTETLEHIFLKITGSPYKGGE